MSLPHAATTWLIECKRRPLCPSPLKVNAFPSSHHSTSSPMHAHSTSSRCDEAGGRDGGGKGGNKHPFKFNTDEVPTSPRITSLCRWPHSWNISAGGYGMASFWWRGQLSMPTLSITNKLYWPFCATTQTLPLAVDVPTGATTSSRQVLHVVPRLL
jgi:hypothetical protein